MKKIIIIGSGGHAKVLTEILYANPEEYKVLGIVNPFQKKEQPKNLLGLPILYSDEELLKSSPCEIFLVNGIGSTKTTQRRKEVYEKFKRAFFSFAQIVSKFSYMSNDLVLGEGLQVVNGAIVHPGCVIGDNVIINTKASIDHDCRIGSHSHVAPGVTICGAVCIGENTHIGTGAVVIQGVTIGSNCFIAAGAVVTKDVPDGFCAKGVPAKNVYKWE